MKPDLFSIAQAHAWQSKRADPTNFMESGKRPIGKAVAKKLAALFKTDYRIFL